jgi:hypothetical protein
MSDDPYADRRRLTFEQAEGAEPLPGQLLPKELSRQLRALLWMVVHETLMSDVERSDYGQPFFGQAWQQIFYDFHVMHDHKLADEFSNAAKFLIEAVKVKFTAGSYIQVLVSCNLSCATGAVPSNSQMKSTGHSLKEGQRIVCLIVKQSFPSGLTPKKQL